MKNLILFFFLYLLFAISYIQAQTYCGASGNSASYEWIQTVQINTINNTSSTNAPYTDYTSISTTMNAGASYNISLTPGFGSSPYNEGWAVWIDFNDDGDFADSGEKVFTHAPSSTTVSGTITIPTTVTNKTTRMRVFMHYNVTPTDPCNTANYGEVEDYTVVLSGSGGTDNTAPSVPTSLTTSSTTQTSTQLSWNASTDNVGVTGYNVYRNGSFIGTTTGTNYTVTGLSASTTYSFYVRAKDAAGNVSSNSNTKSVTTLSGGTTTGDWLAGTNVLYTYDKVGVNTSTPNSNLEISAGSSTRALSVINGGTRNFQVMGDGTTYAREVMVQLNNFPDYVFDSNYDLIPLEELEQYIQKNKHLPHIPSAKEMEKNPLGLATLNKLYLEKIEELTLYTIEQQKVIEDLVARLEQVERQLGKRE